MVDNVYLYEGLFLLNQQAVAADFKGCIDFLRQVFQRAGAEVLVLRKWDERKLAYPIRSQKRGVYILVYFKAAGGQITAIERDCNLSDQVLRCMVLRADHIGEVELELAKRDAELSLEVKLRGPEREEESEHEREPAASVEADEEFEAPAAARASAKDEADDAES